MIHFFSSLYVMALECSVASKYTVREKLKAHNAPVQHIDWSTDSAHIQSSCIGYEVSQSVSS
jgi:hypothetical protein